MMCPHGHARLQIMERHGVEIDYCPECRGAWLDRGELDKIIEQAASSSAFPTSARDSSDRDDQYRRGGAEHGGMRKKKRESFLGDLFDF